MKLEDIDRRIAEWKDIMTQARARVDAWSEVRQEFVTAPGVPVHQKVRELRKTPKKTSLIVSLGDQVLLALAGATKGGGFTSPEVSARVKENLKPFKSMGFKFSDKKISARTQQVLFEITHGRKKVPFRIVDTGQTLKSDGGKRLKIYRKE